MNFQGPKAQAALKTKFERRKKAWGLNVNHVNAFKVIFRC